MWNMKWLSHFLFNIDPDYFNKGLLNISLQCPKCQKNITIKENAKICIEQNNRIWKKNNSYIGNSAIKNAERYCIKELILFFLNSKTSIPLIKYIINLNVSLKKI